MKKALGILGIILLITATTVSAQTTAKKTTTAAKPKLTDKDLAMCDKEWKVVSVEEWGVVTKPPGDRNKTDMMKLTADGKFDVVLFGNKKSGTWTKSGQYIYFTDAATKGKFNFKIISSEPTKLKVDHFSEDEGHSIFEMEAK